MIKNIHVENFKSLGNCTVECGSLNMFTGINASGKSTLLQCLLIVRQSLELGTFFRKKRPGIILSGNDTYVNLGTFKDVLCTLSEKGQERIKIQIDSGKSLISFVSKDYSPENKDSSVVEAQELKFGESVLESIVDHDVNLIADDFIYLSADRIPPKESYPRFKQIELMDSRGEFTAHYLDKFGTNDIPLKELSFTENPSSYSLTYQVNEWLSIISESIEVVTKENLNTNEIELSYRRRNADGTPSQDQKPQNTGYGITHTLPIIVAMLAAKRGQIVIIENPETHLHPAAQSKLAHLICKAAAAGVQVFVETHSDHIINGVRIAVKTNIIKAESCFINFFTRNNLHLSENRRLLIDSEGGVEDWPPGFFDEWDNSINELI